MTGMRSWTAEVTALGIVVRIEHDLSHSPLGSLHRSQSPANANNSPLLTGHWWQTLRRRSQKRRLSWTRMLALADRWLPRPRVLHPYPADRFAASHPR